MKRPYLFIIVLALFTMSCSKTSSYAGKKPTVYVSGLSGVLGISTQGVVWVGDSATNFSGAGEITSVSVNGRDIYSLAGKVYWKNGVDVTVPDILFSSNILVAQNDVFIIGASLASSNAGVGTTAAAVYWKNGSMVNLTQNLPDVVAASTKGIAVSGNDVYVCGYLYTGYNDTLDAVYWKNGQLNYLPDGYMAKCIAVSGSDVYVGGTSLHNGDVYWKNGVMQILGNASQVNAITTSGSDVYVAGYTAAGPNEACYWKNGQLMPLPEGNAVTGIAVYASDVYCSGNTNSNHACFWKNGVVDTLGVGVTSSIVVGP
ncbi:MAG TPA: hypothetical protein VK543_13310 [Puia sp.]|nr:hypothetical protein [Puia sp.]